MKNMIEKETSTMADNSIVPEYLSDLFDRVSSLHSRELRSSETNLATPLIEMVTG